MAFQLSAFQSDSFQVGLKPITDTDVVEKPVDYALGGEQRIKDRYREFDIRNPNYRERAAVKRGGVSRLSGGRPSFTTRTDQRGYD